MQKANIVCSLGVKTEPCQHRCPIVLVHKSQCVHQLVHWHDQPSFEAGRVQVDRLVASSHAEFALALGARVDRHEVGTLGLRWHKLDTGEKVGQVVHGLDCFGLQIYKILLDHFKFNLIVTLREGLPKSILDGPTWPEPVRICQVSLCKGWVSFVVGADQDVTFEVRSLSRNWFRLLPSRVVLNTGIDKLSDS